MAFDPRLSLLRELGGSGFGQSTVPFVSKRIWFLATADTPTDVESVGYFDAEILLARGDLILASMSNVARETPVAKVYSVTAGSHSGDAANALGLAASTLG